MTSIRKQLLRTLGLISLGLGIVGIFMPLMPTTIFLIIASYCFIKSSDTLHRWLINHKVLGVYLANVKLGARMPLKVKLSIFVVFLVTILISIVLITS